MKRKSTIKKPVSKNTTPKVWKTVIVGDLGTGPSLVRGLTDDDVGNECARKIDSEPTMDLLLELEQVFSIHPVDLALVGFDTLGVKPGSTYEVICEAAYKLGLKQLHEHAAPDFARQYINQPVGETIIVATKRLRIKGDEFDRLFSVYSSCGKGHIYACSPDNYAEWDDKTKFVFEVPSKE